VIVSWVLLVLLVLGALAFVGSPLLRPSGLLRREGSGSSAIREKEAAIQLLRELEHDRQTGKLEEGDYRTQRAEAEARAIGAMKQLDSMGEAVGEDLLERTIRLERIRLEGGASR